ncbi:MAG TPA: hypothetical protein VLG11_00245 [Candidatus Saccharimonadales bacterium]|nr:hypothetical protein [Candidatus Saccharimonadales bacterium]
MAAATNYQPNAAVLQALQKVNLVAVVGPSGSGKTTLVNLAIRQDPDIHVVVSDVSRPKRPEEREGIDYFFRTRDEMLAAIERREYVQIAPSNTGDIYATHIENYPTTGIALMPVWAFAIPEFRKLPFGSMRTLFIVPESYESWQVHLGLHNFTPEFRAKRLAEACASFEFAASDSQVELIINGDLTKATQDFLHAIKRAPNEPMPDQTAARAIVQDLLAKLKTETV